MVSRALRALVVDDEPNIAYLVAASLRIEHIEVVTAGDGEEALRVLREQQFDVIVLDIMLPGMDGFEVFYRLRSMGMSTPVLFLSARDATADRVRGLSIGGDDYVVKPFSVEELVARVRTILRRAGSLAPSVLEVGDLRLDEEAHRVTRGGVEVHLSPTEYKLLRFLMVNAGKVMSRAQILDHVWEYDFDGESAIVESFMSYLRKRVDSGEPKLIQTIRGVGYTIRLDQ